MRICPTSTELVREKKKMTKYPKRYIDKDDVERGYYVYAHVCKKTREVFYVGKGFGKRAWETDKKRSGAWQDKVESLEDGFEVILLHEDLTEIESIVLEENEIEKQGGCEALGGRLTNWLPGECTIDERYEVDLGEFYDDTKDTKTKTEDCLDASGYSIFFEDKEVTAARDLSPDEKVAIADSFEVIVGELYQRVTDIIVEKEEPPEIIDWMYGCTMNIDILRQRLKKKKIKYDLRFIEQIASEIDQMDMAEDEVESRKGIKLAKELRSAVKDWFRQFLK